MQIFIPLRLCTLFSYMLLLLPVVSFNIDEEYPIVVSNSFHHPNAHFGISVNLLANTKPDHRYPSRDKQDKAIPTGWVLISAPKANSSHPNHLNINEPGVIWRCALGRFPATVDDDCRILEMDPTGEYDPKTRKLPQMARKDNGWLGGAMLVVGSDRFVACASRWVNQKYKATKNEYFMNGMCYWVPASHVMSDHVNVTWPWLPPKYSYRLAALLNNTQQLYTLSTSKGKITSYDFGLGQFGFSMSISKNNEMIIGAPGVFEWTGTVVQFKDVQNPRIQHERFNLHPGATSAFSEFFVANIQKPSKLSTVLSFNDFLGYAVGTGSFFDMSISQNRTQYVAGAPRSGLMSGKVFVFSFLETNRSSTAELDYLVRSIKPPVGQGEYYGSYFGSVISVGDVNNDGFDDLLIGAPLFGTIHINPSYHSKALDDFDMEIGDEFQSDNADRVPDAIWRMVSGDEGCIFVYSSNGYDFVRSPQQICGDKIPGARFGSAISILGDINLDGYTDVAVGAPYENDNHGAVYIYHGGNSLIFTQKLSPELIDPGIRSFGYSLSAGADIDGNSYPDLAVGAYESNQVIVFRTVPLVKFSTNIFSTIPKLFSTTPDFNITVCVSYNGSSLPEFLGLWVELLIKKTDLRSNKRFLTWSTNGNDMVPQSKVQKRLNFEKTGTCYNFTATRNGEFNDLSLQTINIGLMYWIYGYDSDIITQPIHYEITRNGTTPLLKFNESQPGFHDFEKRKSPISITNKHVSTVLSIPIGSICESDGDPNCLADLSFVARFKDRNSVVSDSRSPFVLGSSDILTLELEIWNRREIALLPITVDISWNGLPTIKRAGRDCDILNRESGGNFYRCQINRAIHEDKMELIQLDLDMSEMYAGEMDDYMSFTVDVNTSSELIGKEAKKILTLPLECEMEFEDYSYEYEAELETVAVDTFNFSHAFEINLAGSSPIHAARIEINIPNYIEIESHYHELILVRKPLVTYDGTSSCYVVNGSFIQESTSTITPVTPIDQSTTSKNTIYDNSIEEIIEVESGYEKQRREDAEIAKEIFRNKLGRQKRSAAVDSVYDLFRLDNILEGEGKIFVIRCGNEGVTCLKVVCDVMHFHQRSKSIVELKLRLKTSVTKMLINERSDIQSISFETLGVIKMIDRHGNTFGNFANLNVSTRLIIPEPLYIPAWIIITSVAAGLILLALITVTLSKCGFFNRTKKTELESLKANENQEVQK